MFGFPWDIGQVIFLGAFYTVLVVIITSFVTSALRTRKDLKAQKQDKIRWHSDFHELPEIARHCRHELTGEVDYRLCPNEFDCRHCRQHPEFEAKRKQSGVAQEQLEENILGFTMPHDRLYHRGHTWVKPEEDGILTVGLDDFGARLIGKPDAINLPEVGSQVQVNGTAWSVKRHNSDIRILSPVEGEIIETGSPEKGWYLRIKPEANNGKTDHLLRGAEIRPWLLREMERLQYALAIEGTGAALADGGLLVEDPASELQDVNWDNVWGELFLEP